MQVSGVATHINQSLRRQVDTLKLLELQNCFFPPVILIKPGRRLIKKVRRLTGVTLVTPMVREEINRL